jgi:hypothetical protein
MDVTCNGPLACQAASINTRGTVMCVNGGEQRKILYVPRRHILKWRCRGSLATRFRRRRSLDTFNWREMNIRIGF